MLHYIDIGKAEGARLVTGGGRAKVDKYPDGLLLQPTIFDDVVSDMVVATQEIFGPVMTFQRIMSLIGRGEVTGRLRSLPRLRRRQYSHDRGDRRQRQARGVTRLR